MKYDGTYNIQVTPIFNASEIYIHAFTNATNVQYIRPLVRALLAYTARIRGALIRTRTPTARAYATPPHHSPLYGPMVAIVSIAIIL
jgi:hypothetical protein